MSGLVFIASLAPLLASCLKVVGTTSLSERIQCKLGEDEGGYLGQSAIHVPQSEFSTDVPWVQFGVQATVDCRECEVAWIRPDNTVHFRRVTQRCLFNQLHINTLPVDGHQAAEHPGLWKVHLYNGSELLASEEFVLSEGSD